MNKPEISIITPSYNSLKYLPETVESVLNQTFQNWEWFIIDDHSTDGSFEYLQSLDDNRIKVFQNQENLGAAQTRNVGLKKAQGRYITFIDSDDLWKANFLESAIKYLQENNESLVYASYERVDENLNPKLKDFKAIDKVDLNRILYNCPIPMLTAMYDSQEIGVIEIPIVEKREDHAMWIEILRNIKYARAIDIPLGVYRIRDNSYSRNKIKLIYHQFNLYNKYLRLPLYKSIYYTITWGINGILKYS